MKKDIKYVLFGLLIYSSIVIVMGSIILFFAFLMNDFQPPNHWHKDTQTVVVIVFMVTNLIGLFIAFGMVAENRTNEKFC